MMFMHLFSKSFRPPRTCSASFALQPLLNRLHMPEVLGRPTVTRDPTIMNLALVYGKTLSGVLVALVCI